MDIIQANSERLCDIIEVSLRAANTRDMSRNYLGVSTVPDYITRICPVCGKEYLADKKRLKHGRQTTCSRKCSYEFRFEKNRKRETRTCLHCKKTFDIPLSLRGKRGAGKYCCRKCRDEHRVGENHPQFLNGRKGERRGKNWQAQRRRALRRDKYTCQECGVNKKSLPEGQQLHVHHIRPFRLFNDYYKANQLKNLITLCSACHRIAEAELQRQQLAADPPLWMQHEIWEESAWVQ